MQQVSAESMKVWALGAAICALGVIPNYSDILDTDRLHTAQEAEIVLLAACPSVFLGMFQGCDLSAQVSMDLCQGYVDVMFA